MLNSSTGEPQIHKWPIIGHETTVHLLQGALGAPNANSSYQEAGGPRHAYLFVGPRHVGKTTLAETFAKALLCSGSSNEKGIGIPERPCNACRSCRLVDSGNHPDLRRVQPTDKSGDVDRSSGMLRVEQAGEIIHEAVLSPLESKYKCFIIQDIHTANASFANKLLKTLEEPPAHVIILLTATDRSSLLPTIVSRCQILDLRSVAQQTTAKALEEKWQVPESKAELLARLSNGRVGWAIEQIDNQSSWEWRQEQLELLWKLIRSDRVNRLAFVESVASKRGQQELFLVLELWMIWWRDIMLAQSGCLEACTNIDAVDEIEKLATQLAPHVVQTYVRTLKKIEGYLRHTTNIRLALDVLVLQLPSATR